MKTMRRDQDMVAWTKVTLALAVDPQTRRAGEEQDPFIVVLIIWFICWRGLTGRDDPLDPHTLSQKQLGDDLLGCPSGKVIEQIDHRRPSGLGNEPADPRDKRTSYTQCEFFVFDLKAGQS
jgi:hypothetical protein